MEEFHSEFNRSNCMNSDNNVGYKNDHSVNWNNQPQNSVQNIPLEEYNRAPLPPPPLPPRNFTSMFMDHDQRSSQMYGEMQLYPPLPPPPPQFPQTVMQATNNMTLLSNSTYHGSEVSVSIPSQCLHPPMSYLQEQQFQISQSPSSSSPYMMFNQPLNAVQQQHYTSLISPQKDFIEQKLTLTTVECNSDEKWINDWLKSIGKLNSMNLKQTQLNGSSDKQVKIYEIKEKVLEIKKLLAELENSSNSLSVMYKSLDESEWMSRCNEIELKKKKLSDLLGFLVNSKEMILEVKMKLEKRKKKRERQKRKREEWKQEKVENSIRRQQLHQSIDKWLENMQDTVERGRREEELKREADSVLSDVTRKKTEAKRQIALLTGLLKLRQARVTALIATGKNISQQQTEAFNSVIERLKTLWTNQLKDYLLEEQGLKVMLNEAAAEEKNSEDLKRKEALNKWKVVLFGKIESNEYQPHDMDELISIRKRWDQFVVDEGTVMSSSIPTGWVVPVKASDCDWMKYNKLNCN